MILRQSAEDYTRDKHAGLDSSSDNADAEFHPANFFGLGLTTRQQLAFLAGVMVVVTILLTFSVGTWAASSARLSRLDSELSSKAFVEMTELREEALADPDAIRQEVWQFKNHNPFVRIAVSPAGSEGFYGDPVPVGGEFVPLSNGDELSTRTLGSERVVVRRSQDGEYVALSQMIDPYGQLVGSLGAGLLIISGLGALLAWGLGNLVVAAGLRPLQRLQRAAEEVTRTGKLRMLPVDGDDEWAQVSASYNDMLRTIQDSRTRQAQLVADAGHELKTPLTSMRTNIELLNMLYSSGRQDQISQEDLADLQHDVIAQMEEMSSLITDLVDLAREDAPGAVSEEFRLDEVIEEALERGRRRRPDVQFRYRADPWIMRGDRAAMVRAPLNIIDNALKWSPPGGTVRISLRAATRRAVLIVDDSGPGIPPEERDKVFQRFYRATETRSTPGSGLGLAITHQVLERHKAKVFVEESDDGGARFRVVFPGRVPSERELAGEVDPDVEILEAGVEL